MNKMNWLKRLNPILFLVFIIQAVTGLGYFLISGEILEEIHLIGGILMILIAVIHLALNWTWIRSNYFERKH